MIIQTLRSKAYGSLPAVALIAGLAAAACGQSPQAAPAAPQAPSVGPPPVQVSADVAQSSTGDCGSTSSGSGAVKSDASKSATMALADAVGSAQIAMPTAATCTTIPAPAPNTATTPTHGSAAANATTSACSSAVVKDKYGNPVVSNSVGNAPAQPPQIASAQEPAPAATLPNLPAPAPAPAAGSIDPAQVINGIAQVVSLVTTLTNAANGQSK